MSVSEQRHKGESGAGLERVGLGTTILSVLAAFFGVQGSRARARDFSRGSAPLFFGVALALTGVFVLLLMLVVRVLIRQAV